MKKKLTIALTLLLIPFLESGEDIKFSYFSHHSLYVYAMGSWIMDVPSDYYTIWEYYPERAASFASLVGIGYTIVNVKDKFLVNLEFDYTSAEFDFISLQNMRIDFYTLMVNLEYRFSATKPLAAYVGIGVGGIDYSQTPHILDPDIFIYPYDEVEYTTAFNLGLKVSLARHLLLRTEVRLYREDYGADEYYYFIDDYGFADYWDDGKRFGTALSLGLEYHF